MRKIIILLSVLLCSTHLVAQTKRALVIAIGDYPKESRWADLSSANDVNHLNAGLLRFGFKSGNIQVLGDSNARKQKIMTALQGLSEFSRAGDIVFIHFSSHALNLNPNTLKREKNRTYVNRFKSGSFIVPYEECFPSDDPLSLCGFEVYINIDEVIALIDKIRRKVGVSGQVVLSLDVSEVGAREGSADSKNLARGGLLSDHMDVFSQSEKKAPFIFLSPSNNNEMSYELKDDDGKGVGPLSYAFGKAATQLDTSSTATFDTLYQRIKSIIQARFPRVTPTIAGDHSQGLFKNTPLEKRNIKQSTVNYKLSGNCYIVTIGVESYKTSGSVINSANAATDAMKISEFVSQQFSSLSPAGKIYSFIQTTRQTATGRINYKPASRDSIYHALNAVINNSRPDDYFIFNFSGTSVEYLDSNQQVETYFLPSDLGDITDSNEVKRKGISLTALKDLFELIPANNQLIITEAGNSETFQQRFVKKLFESAPALQSLTLRNRIIIVPNGMGYDEFWCGGNKITSGPLNHYIRALPEDLNIFSLFSSKREAEKIEYAIKRSEYECQVTPDRPYSRFFFEKQFIEELFYYFQDGGGLSRSNRVSNAEKTSIQRTIKKKHALIIGTNTYSGKPDWNDLNNPIPDATEIANELERNYGFETKRLLDPSVEDVYEALFYYANVLDSSDQFFVFIAGHGDFDSTFFDDGLLVFANSAAYKKDRFKKSYIKYGELQKIINQYRARSVFVMLDVCFGGTFDARIAQQFRTRQDVYAPMENSSFLSEKLKYRSRIYLTSGGKNVVPDGYNKMHSPFAKQFLKALRDATERGILTTSNIFSYVETLPSEPKKGTFGSDQPGSEFIFMTTKKN